MYKLSSKLNVLLEEKERRERRRKRKKVEEESITGVIKISRISETTSEFPESSSRLKYQKSYFECSIKLFFKSVKELVKVIKKKFSLK